MILKQYHLRFWYWFVRANLLGIPKIHIFSKDKKIHLEYPLFDREVPVVPYYVRQLLSIYLEEEKRNENDTKNKYGKC